MGALENNISQHNTLCTIHYTREQSRANEYHSSCYDAFVLDKTLKLFLTQPVPPLTPPMLRICKVVTQADTGHLHWAGF